MGHFRIWRVPSICSLKYLLDIIRRGINPSMLGLTGFLDSNLGVISWSMVRASCVKIVLIT